jgi:hypothetical protein
VGLTVISAFEDLESGRQKVLRYRKDANARNSGGFLLEVFQEDCAGFPPWVRQDTSSQYQQHYNNVNIGTSNVSSSANMADTRTEEQQNCRYPSPDDNTNRSHGSYFSKQEQTPYVFSAPCETSNTGDKLHVYSVGTSDWNERVYSHSNNNSVAHESNISATDNGKNKIQQNVPQQNKSAVNIETEMNKHLAFDILQEYNTMNNSGKQIYKFNFIHKDISVADKSTVSPSVDTEGHFSNNTNKQEHPNDDYNVSRSHTDESRGCELDGANCSQRGTTRERRDVASDRLWSIGETACRARGFAQWLAQVKHHFWNRVWQLMCLAPRCQAFSQVSGWILSPGYPRAYPNNLNCCYR